MTDQFMRDMISANPKTAFFFAVNQDSPKHKGEKAKPLPPEDLVDTTGLPIVAISFDEQLEKDKEKIEKIVSLDKRVLEAKSAWREAVSNAKIIAEEQKKLVDAARLQMDLVVNERRSVGNRRRGKPLKALVEGDAVAANEQTDNN